MKQVSKVWALWLSAHSSLGLGCGSAVEPLPSVLDTLGSIPSQGKENYPLLVAGPSGYSLRLTLCFLPGLENKRSVFLCSQT